MFWVKIGKKIKREAIQTSTCSWIVTRVYSYSQHPEQCGQKVAKSRSAVAGAWDALGGVEGAVTAGTGNCHNDP